MSESNATNIIINDITTVKVTECKGAKALYHKYQERLYKFSGFLGLARKKCQSSMSCVCRYFFRSVYGFQKAEEHSEK